MAFHDHLSQEMALHHFTDQHLTDNTAVLRGILPEQLQHSSPDAAGKTQGLAGGGGGGAAPTWLNSAILRHANSDSSASNQWLSRPVHGEGDEVQAMNQEKKAGRRSDSDEESDWQSAKCKADILAHPLYEQLLSAHVQCLRIATPVDQLPRIDAQLAQSQHVVAKYSVLGHGNQTLDDKDLDQFMTHYVLLLSSFKEQLQQHVRVHAMEAVMACWELEQSLLSLTGVAPGEGSGATMSDDDDDQADSDTNLFDGNLDGPDSMGFGPLVPTENERSLMERVRQELKHELKQGYKDKIVDIREEILRKRRAGKLPGDTTSLLKAWWQSHSKWPYPTEEDKARLVQETGLQLKQINNWFINQRKRNWHSNPSSSSTPKSKRKKSNAGEPSNERFM
ncbi:homeobox protein knotted-1-like LET12 isoform X1 [Diospyros lotus]|uniref:homeobox protein knotted-1-like LET12 isoform X1 n=2 Tax=Diospyros lotus TaxID=55363 RepID=UPI0022568A68|nr:homeobox protein knotted-1-like LET12 isoform X1 [Diospyros lotus]XP_052199274.1 homeobox protein knotted-1-like LET12 isoform X1 [Diospyros lotus]